MSERWHTFEMLDTILSQTRSQWSLCMTGVMWSVLGALKIMQADVFCVYNYIMYTIRLNIFSFERLVKFAGFTTLAL